DAAQLAVPSLLITAERGDVVRDDDVAELQRATPSMRHVRVPDAGHMIPWDNARGFYAAFGDFLGAPLAA
ncbi:alpha/beta hydrolase, partial [Burkholderia multivorans]